MIEMILLLLGLHWFGDFICQTRWMANNKSKNLYALSLHVLAYTTVLTLGVFIGTEIMNIPLTAHYLFLFAFVNYGLHWMTDITTSQITKYFWFKQDIYKFFGTIGLDQYIHHICLILTAREFIWRS